jgi:hypothetical protein
MDVVMELEVNGNASVVEIEFRYSLIRFNLKTVSPSSSLSFSTDGTVIVTSKKPPTPFRKIDPVTTKDPIAKIFVEQTDESKTKRATKILRLFMLTPCLPTTA